jgi:hypothetical protein
VRLTLRTLLAYLDDTLEPAEAKLIGQKVAESDTAQELIGRIKQVTRRRRLTIPPPTGPGGKLDPNTIAEYLDNTLGPDPTAEVEQTCLGSDVHLAELAACHQILTLVLGEPVLIPPSSRQRMYGLVKGREAIPFRKAPTSEEGEPARGDDYETDETLRLGLPAYRTRGSWSSQLVVIGGGLAAGLLLFLAIWQALRSSHRPTAEASTPEASLTQAKGPGASDDTSGKERPTGKEPDATARQDSNREASTGREKTQKGGKTGGTGKEPALSTETGDKNGKKNGSGQGTAKEDQTGKHTMPSDIPVEAPSAKEVELGQYLPAVDGPGLLLQRQTEKGTWRVLDSKDAGVISGRPLVSLPGCPATVQMDSGLRLNLWGALREDLLFPPVQESRVVLHYHPAMAVDLTLQRGRIVLTNPQKKPLQARVRFDNPTNPNLKETWDITLEEQGTEALLDLWHQYPLGEPFYDNPKERRRMGPEAYLHLIVRKGSVLFHRDDKTMHMAAPPGPALVTWFSLKGRPSDRTAVPKVFEWATAKPTFPANLDAKIRTRLVKNREEMIKARNSLLVGLAGRGERADVALAGMLKSPNREEQILVVRCFGALDNLPELVDALADEERPDVRVAAVDVLRSWIANDRDNDYRLLAELRTKYSKIESGNILILLHSFAIKDVRRVETYEFLIGNLSNPKLALRELAAWHLYRLAPALAANVPPFLASAPAEQRDRVRLEWDRLLKEGKLPPAPPPAPGN